MVMCMEKTKRVCPDCGTPLVYSATGKVPWFTEHGITPVFYCRKCHFTDVASNWS